MDSDLKILKEVDELMKEEDKLFPEDPALKCWNCGEAEWNESGYCKYCKEHWRGKP